MKRRKKYRFPLPALLVVLFLLLYQTDYFLRRRTQLIEEKTASDFHKSVEPGWDKVLLNHVAKLFIPEWHEKILDQERIIEASKDDPEKVIKAYVKIVEIYQKKEKYREAENACNQVLTQYPLHPLRKIVYKKLASIYEKSKKFQKQREINEIYIQEFPDDSEVVKAELKNIVICEHEGNYEKAIEGYQKFLTKYPKTKEKDRIAFKIGLLYKTIGRPDKAREFYQGMVWTEGSMWADNARSELWLKGLGRSNKKLVYAYRVDTPPRIDGRLNDPAWGKGDKVTGFVNTQNNNRISQQTIVSLLYDDENLYIAFNCLESKNYGLVVKCAEHDGDVWGDDCIEVFVDANRDYTSYYHLTVNAMGTKRDGLEHKPADWNPKWKAATAVGTNHWNVEICIPFKEFGSSTPKPGVTWGANFTRARRSGKEEISAWAFTNRNHHQPGKFGYLIFK